MPSMLHVPSEPGKWSLAGSRRRLRVIELSAHRPHGKSRMTLTASPTMPLHELYFRHHARILCQRGHVV